MIKRDFDLSIKKKEAPKKEDFIKKEKKRKKKYEPLSRILVIGPDYPERCHFSENIYDLWSEREGYEIKMVGDMELPVNSMHIEKGLELPLSTIINTLEDWKPQLTIVDQININFLNDLQVPVFYHHRNYFRDTTVFYPTLVWFWHEDILKYYKTNFKKNWMAQVQYHDLMYIAVNPDLFDFTKKKKYAGVNLIGFRELPNEIDDMFETAPQEILRQEYDLFCTLGFNVFESPIVDDQYRALVPQCEALWCPLSRRQLTSRRIIEAMMCRTLVVLKLENKRHEQILEKMGFYNKKHYIGVKRLEDIKEVYEKTPNKQKIIENAYNIVMNHHTYNNRIDQIIETYKEIINKNM